MSTQEENDILAQFGKPRDGGSLNIISIEKDSSKTVRLLPPMKKNGDVWGVYHKQHYGYSVRDSRDPTKTRMRPFLCIEEKDENQLITKSCPECRKREDVAQTIKDEMATQTKVLMDKGLSPNDATNQAKASVKGHEEWLDRHNLDKKWFIPIMLEDGTLGILKIPHSGKKAIDKARKLLKEQEEGRDVFDPRAGAWLKLTRVGTGRETDYDAAVVKEVATLEGGIRATVTKSAPLSLDQLRGALALPDLTSSSIVRRLSPEQIRMLAEGEGSPDEVETVLNLAQKDVRPPQAPRPSPAATPAPTQASKPAAVATAPAAAAPKPAPKVVAPPPPPEDDEEAQALKALEAARARKAAAKAAPTKPVQAPPPALDPDLSDDEFAARFPDPNN